MPDAYMVDAVGPLPYDGDLEITDRARAKLIEAGWRAPEEAPGVGG